MLQGLPTLNDTAKATALIKLSDYYSELDLQKSKEYALMALKLSDDNSFAKGRVDARDNLGLVFILTAQYANAISKYNEAIIISKETNQTKRVAWLLNRLSAAYYYTGNYEQALKSYIKTADEARVFNNREILLDAYNGIASIYLAKGDYKGALKYYQDGLTIAIDSKDESNVALIENNLGSIYNNQKKYNEAMIYYRKALKTYEELKDSSSIALSLMNIGGCNNFLGDYGTALSLYEEAMKIYVKLNGKNGLTMSNINIASIFYRKKDFNSSIEYYNRALVLASETGSKEQVKKCYEGLAENYYASGKFQKAYDYFKLYSDVKDSLFNETNTKSMNELQTKYETDKKENEIVRLNLENDAQTAHLKQQKIRTTFVFTALIFVLIIVFVIYRQYRAGKVTNIALGEKNSAIQKQKFEIENQKTIVEGQNKEITDSINYARQIQQAILPPDSLISKSIQNYFILYKPKAIVSGDFYFFAQKQNQIFIAAVDCTGHGVPGAFMSMIGHNLLTQIITERGVVEPAEILNQLHKSVRHSLQQDSEKAENRDGMDISLITFDKFQNTIEFAGANRPLYIIRENEILETKGDKFPIGGMQYEAERKFSSHTLSLEKGDRVYLFTDGYADQFGGEKGKKFMVKNLQKTLLAVQRFQISEQREQLDKVIEDWRGNSEQIDDILLIGIEV